MKCVRVCAHMTVCASIVVLKKANARGGGGEREKIEERYEVAYPGSSHRALRSGLLALCRQSFDIFPSVSRPTYTEHNTSDFLIPNDMN